MNEPERRVPSDDQRPPKDDHSTDPDDDGSRGRGATRPRHIPGRGWWDILLRVKDAFIEDQVGFVAAAIAYYALLSVFPGLIALVSLYGLVADPARVQERVGALTVALPDEARDIIAGQLAAIAAGSSFNLGLGLALSLIPALWSSSAAVNAIITGVNIAYGERERRPFWKVRGLSILFTLGLIAFVIIVLPVIALVPVVLDAMGLAGWTRAILVGIRWPLVAVFAILALAVLYRFGPCRRDARWRWVSWGSLVATAIWLAASAALSWYVESSARFNEIYGSLGGGIALMLWFYITGLVLLLGAELNGELERQTGHDTTIGRAKPLGERGAYVADTIGESAPTRRRRAKARKRRERAERAAWDEQERRAHEEDERGGAEDQREGTEDGER